MSEFAAALIAWQRLHGRHGLPWQETRDPYRVWLSEIMLQQTQVATVVPYYRRFLRRFPNVKALASASQDEVLRLWSGLGYYARARNLHRAARGVMERFGGRFPQDASALQGLPGVGRSTAAAISALAYGRSAAILDGNVKRVLARAFCVAGSPGERAVDKRLWALAEALLPQDDVATYTQALMDLGATVCLRVAPRCDACPLAQRCSARREGRIAQLPAPRARSPLPERTLTWLVLRRGDRVMLEKRPDAGLWGGLWSFPEASACDARLACARLGYELRSFARLAPLRHAFTHFRLRAEPLLCEVAGAPAAEAPGRVWLQTARALQQALPSPVRALLRTLGAAGPPPRASSASRRAAMEAARPGARSPRKTIRNRTVKRPAGKAGARKRA